VEHRTVAGKQQRHMVDQDECAAQHEQQPLAAHGGRVVFQVVRVVGD